jgi:hypothetical protein
VSKTREYAQAGFLLGMALTWVVRGLTRFVGRHPKAVLVTCILVWCWYQISPQKQRDIIHEEVAQDAALVTVQLVAMHASESWGKTDTATFEVTNGARAAIRNIGMVCSYESRINVDYVDPDDPKPKMKWIRGQHRVNIMVQPGETRRFDMVFNGTVIESTKRGLENCKADFDWDDASLMKDRPELDFRTQADIVELHATYAEQQACFSCTRYFDITVLGRLENRSKTRAAKGGSISCMVIDGNNEGHRFLGEVLVDVPPGKSRPVSVKFKKLNQFYNGILRIDCLPDGVYAGEG